MGIEAFAAQKAKSLHSARLIVYDRGTSDVFLAPLDSVKLGKIISFPVEYSLSFPDDEFEQQLEKLLVEQP